jgi:L-ascorbate metabolism protein UlaG (beta-lactamase superfamily)
VLAVEGARIYHSGDTVPFEGLAAEVSALRPDIALLPVNGRSKALAEAGIAGNLTLAEACNLASVVGAKHLIAHHHGMFAFNTLAAEVIDAAAASSCTLHIHRARTSVEYRLKS